MGGDLSQFYNAHMLTYHLEIFITKNFKSQL